LLLRFVLRIAFIFSFAGCVFDAPRDNPMDPVSSLYVANAVVNGRVVLNNLKSIGVSMVFVKELQSVEATITDSLGYFTFSKFSSGSKSLIIQKEGFVSDTLRFLAEAGKQITLQSSLNAFPIVTSAIVLTRKIARYFPSTLYYAAFSASIFDANGVEDIDSVWLSIDTTIFPMDYSVADKNFHCILYQNQLSSNNLQSLVGKPMKIIVRDAGKAIGQSSPFFVSRIIEEEPKPLFPVSISSVDTTTVAPEFQWNELKANFTFSYTLTLARVDDGGNKTVVWTKSKIPSFLLSFQYDDTPLQQGNYSWAISIVDDYGNYSTSKEATFVAK
jgi:hypothetical protein